MVKNKKHLSIIELSADCVIKDTEKLLCSLEELNRIDISKIVDDIGLENLKNLEIIFKKVKLEVEKVLNLLEKCV